jgi:hypothetical protein
MRSLTGENTRLITCLANWNGQNPLEIVPDAIREGVGLFGFAKPSMMKPIDWYLSQPLDSLKGDTLTIAIFARVFNNLPLDYVKK